MLKTKNLYRLAFYSASFALLALVRVLRLLVELLALASGSDAQTPKTAYDRRHSWERDGYSWEGRPDELK